MNRKAISLALIGSLASASTAQAGLLDWLFGRREPAPVVASAHPNVTVASRKRVAKVTRQPTLVYLSPSEMMARTIDPVENPDWYLIDPTLKRGDVLVLPDRVLVFAGGQVGASENYVALERTRILKKSERTLIAAMTGRSYAPPLLTAGVAPKQPRLLASNGATQPASVPGL